MNKHTRARLVSIVSAAVLLVSVAATLLACGSGGTGNNAAGDVSTYTDKTYGFSFGYPSDWKLQEAADQPDVTSGAAPTTVVAAFDPDGAKTDASFTDIIEVSIYKLNVVIDDSVMADLKVEVEATFADLEAQATDLKVVEAMSEASVAGIKGWKITYQFDKEGTPAESTLYLLFSGNLEYQLLVQAATANWQADQPTFQAFLSSFKPGAGSVTTDSTSG